MAARDLYVVFSRPLDGREEDFERWYDEVHIPELLELDEVIAARRYRLVAGEVGEATSMAVYECAGDGQATADAIATAMTSGTKTPTDAIDTASMRRTIWKAAGTDPRR
jgi:hypothetical protein